MSYGLPFARGSYWASGENGAIPSGILGKSYLDARSGVLLQVVKNTDASAIAGCKAVSWETASKWEVEKVAAVNLRTVAGIVDPEYANKGRTVPVNAAFFIVKRGRTYAIAGATIVNNTAMRTISAASNGTEGRVQGYAVALSNNIIAGALLGVFRASANAAASVLCDVNIP